MPVGERAGLAPGDDDRARWARRPAASGPRAMASPAAGRTPDLARVERVREHVLDLRHRSTEDRPARDLVRLRRPRVHPLQDLEHLGRVVVHGRRGARARPSNRYTAPWCAPQRLTAFVTMVSKTGWTSVCDRLITRRISEVAVCCSRASVRSAFLVCSSFRSRAFSIAIAAWSAKVSMRATWLSVNARTSCRKMRITPSSSPARSMGIARVVRLGSISRARSVYSGSVWTSRMWTVRRSRAARALALWRPGAMGLSSRNGPELRGDVLDRHHPQHPSVEARDHRSLRLAQSDRVLGQGLEHRLQIEGGPPDHLEQLAGRGLLLERDPQLAVARLQLLEQARRSRPR